MNRFKTILIPMLLLLIATSIIPPIVSALSSRDSTIRSNLRINELLSVFDEEENFEVIEINIPGSEVIVPDNPIELREFIIVTKEWYVDDLENYVFNIKYVYRVRDNAIVFAMVSRDQVLELVDEPWVLNIAPSPTIRDMISKGIVERENIVKQSSVSSSSNSNYGLFSSWDIMGIRQTWETYGITGEGIVVGVADTGIDFGYQELGSEAIARDSYGVPLTATVDEHFALTALDTVVIGGRLNTAYRWFPIYRTYHSRTIGSPSVVTSRYTINFIPPAVVSKSGVYKFGALQWFFADYVKAIYIILTIPVVLVDANTPGVYDTVVFDLSTAFYSLCYGMYYTLNDTTWRPPNPAWLDYSFADEPVFSLNNPVIARDFDGDGIYDFSLGSIAGTVIDTWGTTDYTYNEITRTFIFGSPGQRPGLPSSGKYVTILTDWNGHGTSVASIIGARGKFNYVGYSGSTYKYYGVAYGAKIAGATGFWFGDMISAVYWLAGYDYIPEIDWFIPSTKRSDIVSNSWSYSNLAELLHQSPGVDYLTLIFDELALWNPYQAVIVFAAGNSGPGYGSVTSPSAGLFIITVGASTNFEYYQIYGYSPGYADDITMFSSRGPNALGYPKPDVVAVGGYEWAGVRVIEGRGWGITRYWEANVGPGLTLFSGTSEATPFVSGVIALGLQAIKWYGLDLYHTPMVMKVLLKSSCDDLDYPVLIQGSGRVNAYKLVKTILEGDFVAYVMEGLTNAVFENYYNVYGDYLYEWWFLDTAHYAVLPPGVSDTFNIYLELGSGTVSADAVTYSMVRRVTVFDGVYDFTEKLFTIPRSLWSGCDYLEIYVVFKNITYSYPYYGITPIDSRYMIRVDAFDYYNNNLYRLNTEARYSTVAVLTIGNLGDRVKGDVIVRLRPAFTPPTPVRAEVVAVLYRAVRFSWISISGIPRYVNWYSEIPVTINVPGTARPGLYEAKIRIYTPSKTIIIPVTILVPLVITSNNLYINIPPIKSPFSYDSYTPIGVVDAWATGHPSRTEALDWRMIPLLIEDYRVAGLILQLMWTSGVSTSLEAVVIPPGGPLDGYFNINMYASYKITARHGYVYNPNPNDQLNGRLRIYVPTKWSMALRQTRVYYHRDISISGGALSETVSYVNYYRMPSYYGLYRLVITYGSYSGSKLFDPVRLTISIVRAEQQVEYIGNGIFRITATFTTAPPGAPFLNAEIYGLTSDTLSNTDLTPLVYGYWRRADGTVQYTNIVYGLYIGTSNRGWSITITYYTTSWGYELETVLVLNMPWHASGAYYYNPNTGALVIVETYYKALVSVSTVID